MSNKKRLISSIIQFLTDEIQSDSLSTDSKESIEVAIQCLETAYEVNPMDASLQTSKKLEDIFADSLKDNTNSYVRKETKPVTEKEKLEAERLKNEGNNLMKSEKFNEALQCYTQAIQIDGSNAVYYCNRAAAHSKLSNHESALDDCKMAISYDPNYSKAYGRMGLAYASLNDHYRARDCYRKAVELDPQNESYRNNLRIADEKVAEQSSQPGGQFGGMPFDLSSLLGNPALMNMATQLMSDPNMQNLMSGLMSGAANSGAQGGPGGPGGTGIDALLQAGQQIAAQMQASNPDLVNQLRTAMTGQDGETNSPNDTKDDQKSGDADKSNN